MTRRSILALVVPTLLLFACGTPVPTDKADYVGDWRAKDMSLKIDRDGHVKYERVRGGRTTSIAGPIRAFKGDDFVVGLPILSTTFVVSRRPYDDGGRQKMVVDGVELTRR